jgi:hypothetical protein
MAAKTKEPSAQLMSTNRTVRSYCCAESITTVTRSSFKTSSSGTVGSTRNRGEQMPEEKVRIKHEIVCVGLTQIAGSKKLTPRFQEVIDGVLDPTPLVWGDLKASPGNVYQIEAEADTPWSVDSRQAFIPKGGRLPWLRLWQDSDARATWEASAKAEQAAKSRASMQADAERQTELKEMCAPLKRVYHSLPWSHRTAFLVMVQEQIVRNVPKKGDSDG